MDRWILVLCHEKPKLDNLQKEWQKNGIFVHIVSDVVEAADELLRNTGYLLVAIFSDGQEYFSLLKIIRELTKAPILVVSRHYSSTEKTAALKAGADEYIRWSDSYLEETIASGLNSCLKRIRRKLEEAGCHSCRIENVRGVGYRFIQENI